MAYFNYGSIKVELTESEIYTLVWALAHEIQSCVGDSHYERHPDSFEQNKGQEIQLAKEFSKAIGREDIIQSELKKFYEWRKSLKEEKD